MNNFSEIFFNKFESPRRAFNKLYTRLNDLKNNHKKDYSLSSNELRIFLLNSIQNTMRQTMDFVDVLEYYFKYNKLPQMSISKFGIKKEEEMDKLGALIRNPSLSNENQTMVFNNVKIEEVYYEGIVQVSNFTLNKDSEPNNVLKSTSTLYYNVVLPFNNKNYPTTYPICTKTSHLPKFFSSHFKR